MEAITEAREFKGEVMAKVCGQAWVFPMHPDGPSFYEKANKEMIYKYLKRKKYLSTLKYVKGKILRTENKEIADQFPIRNLRYAMNHGTGVRIIYKNF